PCKQMMPALESLEQERTDVKFVKFQSTRESEIVKKYGIRSVPTLMVFHTGAVIGTKTGSSTKDQIIKLLDISLNPLG
ncbi:MAG TPA: thioredoxin family protein, partial [Methanosarcina sp.]|nr:thioredoxin family protein [Methanosarcina sp.]